MDDLVYICTKIARQMDANGLDSVFEAAKKAQKASLTLLAAAMS